MDEKMSKDLLWFSIGVGALGHMAARRFEERAASAPSERAKLRDLGSASNCRFMGNIAVAHIAFESFRQSPKFTGAIVLGALGLAALYVRGEDSSHVPHHLVGVEGQHCFACAAGQRPIAYCAPGGVQPLPPPVHSPTGDWGPGF